MYLCLHTQHHHGSEALGRKYVVSTRVTNTPFTLHSLDPRIQADMNILNRMKEFALSVTSSATMTKLANDVAATIDKRVSLDKYILRFPISFSYCYSDATGSASCITP